MNCIGYQSDSSYHCQRQRLYLPWLFEKCSFGLMKFSQATIGALGSPILHFIAAPLRFCSTILLGLFSPLSSSDLLNGYFMIGILHYFHSLHYILSMTAMFTLDPNRFFISFFLVTVVCLFVYLFMSLVLLSLVTLVDFSLPPFSSPFFFAHSLPSRCCSALYCIVSGDPC